MQKCKYTRAKVANIKEEGRIDFYPTLNTCRMRIKAKEESAKIRKFVDERFGIFEIKVT